MTEQNPQQRAQTLIQLLGLQAHPEGGWFREIHRSTQRVQPADSRSARVSLTSIDFLLAPGQHSAWHRVRSDEAWHLLEGGPLRLWLVPPSLDTVQCVLLAPPSQGGLPRHVVPADWWQAAEPAPGAMAWVGATVGPGFEFADFAFGRDDPALRQALTQQAPELTALL